MIALLLLACAAPLDTSADGSTEHQLLKLASVVGSVTVTAPLPEDTTGTLVVFLTTQPSSSAGTPHRAQVETFVDAAEHDATWEYSLTNIFPQEQPYYVGALLDLDESTRYTATIDTTSGDLSTFPPGEGLLPVNLGSGEVLELHLELSELIP